MASEDENVTLDAIEEQSNYDSPSENDREENEDVSCENEDSYMRQSDIISVSEMYDNYTNAKRVTKPFMTRFEKAKILGVRSEMLANGAPALISVPKGVTSTYEIANMEYKQKKIPLMIKRKLPNNSFEYWKIDDLVLI
tara:strand:- start:446 stop:862 length:417 start_codon:yes stop_codon:yes gene_type:complete